LFLLEIIKWIPNNYCQTKNIPCKFPNLVHFYHKSKCVWFVIAKQFTITIYEYNYGIVITIAWERFHKEGNITEIIYDFRTSATFLRADSSHQILLDHTLECTGCSVWMTMQSRLLQIMLRKCWDCALKMLKSCSKVARKLN
jgi:hypothetical protein